MKLTLLVLTFGGAMARLSTPNTGPLTNKEEVTGILERELLSVSAEKDYLGPCVTNLDCKGSLVCNQVVGGLCDKFDDYKSGSLCTEDSQCDDGSIQYCNRDPDDAQVDDAGYGLCELEQSGSLVVQHKQGYLGACVTDGDCEADYVCNSLWNRCDHADAYQRWSLCKDDSHCNAGSTKYCNLNTEGELKSLGFGLCNRLRSGAFLTMCAHNDDCNGLGNYCNKDTFYGRMCGRVGGMGCGGGYQCTSGSCVDGICAVKDEACWERGVPSYSARSGDCIPSQFLVVTPSRSHKHTLADNEFVFGDPAAECKDQFLAPELKDWALIEEFTYDEDERAVTGKITNNQFGSEFCFDDYGFAVGCNVDRYIC